MVVHWAHSMYKGKKMKKIIATLFLVTLGFGFASHVEAGRGSGFGWGFGTGVATGAILSSANRPREVYYVNDAPGYYDDNYYDEAAELRAENRRLRRELREEDLD